jgi:CheY-like chemotaxis protein
MKFLVVDDSKIARRMLIKVLTPLINESEDEVLIAENGKIAVEQYLEHKPDLVFMDLTMPVMDGFEALKKIIKINRDAKVIIVSADIQQTSIDEVMKSDILDFVKKPIDADKMKAIFDKWQKALHHE